MRVRTWYGFEIEAWERGCREAEAFLVACARERRTTTYGELAESVSAIRVRPYSFAMTALVSEACRAFDDERGTVLASLVCRKDSGVPGEGYFAWGERSGRMDGDRLAWWRRELEAVFEAAA